MTKGSDTKNKILDAGFELASKLGLECLSIGTLAKAAHMSKSGLFAHFNSKENLQLAVMMHAGQVFTEAVVMPALKTQAGIPRIKKIMENWIQWTQQLSGGCIFVSAAAEYADRPGLVQEYIKEQQTLWIDCLKKVAQSAVRVGHFYPDTDCERFAFELYSLILGFFLYHNSLDYPDVTSLMDSSFERLITSYKTQ